MVPRDEIGGASNATSGGIEFQPPDCSTLRNGLQHWVQENPAYARALDKHRATYLPGWYNAALPVRRLRY